MAAAVDADKERSAPVERIGGFLEPVGIGVPHGEGLATAVERAGLVAQSEDMLVGAKFLTDGEAAEIQGDGDRSGSVGGEPTPGRIGDGEATIRLVDADGNGICTETDALGGIG